VKFAENMSFPARCHKAFAALVVVKQTFPSAEKS